MQSNPLASQKERRARYMFPGAVFNVQEARKRQERKFRDWDGWLRLVAEYQKDALRGNDPPLHLDRPA